MHTQCHTPHRTSKPSDHSGFGLNGSGLTKKMGISLGTSDGFGTAEK